MKVKVRVFISLVLTLNLLILSAASSNASNMPELKVLQNAAIKTLKEFDSVHSDKVFWNEADIIKAIKSSKSKDWLPVDKAYALKIKSKDFPNTIQLVLRPEHWGGVKEHPIIVNIRNQLGENADKFVYIHASEAAIYKNKSYRTFDLIPFLPWTDVAVGYTENGKVIDLGTAGVGCFTLPKELIKFYKIACSN